MRTDSGPRVLGLILRNFLPNFYPSCNKKWILKQHLVFSVNFFHALCELSKVKTLVGVTNFLMIIKTVFIITIPFGRCWSL